MSKFIYADIVMRDDSGKLDIDNTEETLLNSRYIVSITPWRHARGFGACIRMDEMSGSAEYSGGIDTGDRTVDYYTTMPYTRIKQVLISEWFGR